MQIRARPETLYRARHDAPRSQAVGVMMHHIKEVRVSLSRIFAAIALGVVVAVAFFVRGELTPLAGEASTSVASERIPERSIELHEANAAASAGAWGESITERTLELHAANVAASSLGWRESITERSLELHDRQTATNH